MANEQNLKTPSTSEARERGSKGGINSGKARRRKADLRRMAQEVLDGTFKDKHGKEFTGEEAVIQGLVANLADPKGKNWGKAMDLLVQLLSANKSREEKQMLKAQTALIKAKAELLNVSDDSVLEKLDDVLKQIGE
jgi:LDH2 family malate/lactate/ureidoglycolate dehydrogenase